ncbi:MAG: hypothetical protein QXP97_07050 [Desulfurococcus sp.]|uniref:hypothetical protein n=1 Tax=Desulfurococcus sp. TaxID=51678 RepID=UPI0031668DC4
MQRRPLVVAIYEPKWFIHVLSVLRERNIFFSHYYTRDEVPYGSILYTDYSVFSEEMAGRSDILVFYDPTHDCRILEKAILASYLKDIYNELVIGVDPGRRIGYIVVGDGEYIIHGMGEYIDLIHVVNYLKKCVPAERIIIRVGSRHRGIELASILKKDTGVKVEVVSEDDTTPSSIKIDDARLLGSRIGRIKPFREKDVYAAYKIAMKKGVEVV